MSGPVVVEVVRGRDTALLVRPRDHAAPKIEYRCLPPVAPMLRPAAGQAVCVRLATADGGEKVEFGVVEEIVDGGWAVVRVWLWISRHRDRDGTGAGLSGAVSGASGRMGRLKAIRTERVPTLRIARLKPPVMPPQLSPELIERKAMYQTPALAAAPRPAPETESDLLLLRQAIARRGASGGPQRRHRGAGRRDAGAAADRCRRGRRDFGRGRSAAPVSTARGSGQASRCTIG